MTATGKNTASASF